MRLYAERPANRKPAASPFQQTPILAEGFMRLQDMPAYEKLAYFTLNSIPVKYAFPIACELTKTVLRAGFSRTKKADHLDLRPNYAGLHFTPLEMSFARRPEGALNLLKDMLSGNPYRLLSEVRDGYLYSPDGGRLGKVFPRTLSAMLDDPLTLAILKSDRMERLARRVEEYDNLPRMESMANVKLFSLLTMIGRQNTELAYMFGFRDSLIRAADRQVEGALGSGWRSRNEVWRDAELVREAYADVNRGVPKRGPEGAGKWKPDNGYLNVAYELRKLPAALDEDHRDRYRRLGLYQVRTLDRIFAIREELAQESVRTLGSIEYCRGAFHGTAGELGMRYPGHGGMKEGADIEFLTIYEVSDLMRGRKIDAHAAPRRKQKWEGHNRPRG